MPLQLAGYSHHLSYVLEHVGILLTYEWIPIEEHVGPFVLTLVFHNLETHLHVADEIQALVNTLKLQVRRQAR